MEMTSQEVRDMRGTEFIYNDGSHSIKAFVAEADVLKGLTCKALSDKTLDGILVYTQEAKKKDPGNFNNLICFDLNKGNSLEEMLSVLTSIKNTGKFIVPNPDLVGRIQKCSFI